MENLTGKKYGKLTVLEFSHKVKNQYYWKCQIREKDEKIEMLENFIKGVTK